MTTQTQRNKAKVIVGEIATKVLKSEPTLMKFGTNGYGEKTLHVYIEDKPTTRQVNRFNKLLMEQAEVIEDLVEQEIIDGADFRDQFDGNELHISFEPGRYWKSSL